MSNFDTRAIKELESLISRILKQCETSAQAKGLSPISFLNNLLLKEREYERLKATLKEVTKPAVELYEEYLDKYVKTCNELEELIIEIHSLKEENRVYIQTLEEIKKYCNEQNLKADYTACKVLSFIPEE